MNIERVDKIIRRIELRKAEALGNYRIEESELWADLLTILGEYKQMKAGAGAPAIAKVAPEHGMAEGSTPSPGPLSAEDERELESIETHLQGLEDQFPYESIKLMNDKIRARLTEHPAAPLAEVTEEERAEMGRVLGEMIHSYPVGLTIYVAESDVETLRKARALILATAPGSTAGKPAPVRVSREWFGKLAEILHNWIEDGGGETRDKNDAIKMLAEKGIEVEPEKEG